MVRIERVTLSGFGSYGPKPQTLTLGGRGPVAVVGDNGAGKSTAVSKGLTWALYGKCPPERMGSGTRALTGRAVVGKGQKRAVVAVALTDATGAAYEVQRERGRSGSDVVTVTRDGTKIDGAGQGTIDALIGAGYDTWCRTVVRGQGDPWSFAEATDKRKREILDIISGGAALEATEARAKAKRVEAEAAVRDAKTTISGIRQRLDRIDVASTEARAKRWDADHAEKIQRAEADEKALDKALLEAQAADAKLTDNQAEIDAVKGDEPVLDRQPYREAIDAADAEYNAAFAAFTALDREMKRLSGLSLGDPCPTCTQPVGPAVVETLTKTTAERKKAQAEKDVTAGHRADCRQALEGAEAWLRSERATWRAKLDGIKVNAPQAPAIERERNHARRRLADLRKVVNPYTARLEGERAEMHAAKRDLALAEERERTARWMADAAGAWESALGAKGVRAHMAEATIGAIEAGANRWLSVLSERPMMVEFPPTRQVGGRTKDEIKTIVHIDGETRDLLTFSGGERRRLNLAVDLGVSAACTGGGMAVSLLVLDEEVFSGLDEHGKAAVVHALHGAGIEDIVIIDHDPRLSSTLPRTIRVDRDGAGHSRLTVEVMQ